MIVRARMPRSGAGRGRLEWSWGALLGCGQHGCSDGGGIGDITDDHAQVGSVVRKRLDRGRQDNGGPIFDSESRIQKSGTERLVRQAL